MYTLESESLRLLQLLRDLTCMSQMVCLQPEPKLQLVGTWLLRYDQTVLRYWKAWLNALTDVDLKNFVWDLGKEGFVLQLISLAGLHLNAAATGNVVYVITWNMH